MSAFAAADPIRIVALDREIPGNEPITPAPLMPRELFRQAVLIAARDELGLSTRDEVFGEPVNVADALHLNPDARRAGRGFLTKLRLAGKADAPWNKVLPAPAWTDNLTEAATDAESLSRNALVETLKQFGATGTAAKQDANGKVTADADKLLTRLELFSQLEAVRLIHADIRTHGESPERLAALARGYANFSSISRFIWSGVSRAAAARSLLYAERAVVKFPESADSLYGRAYARSLIGLPKAALEDIDTLAKKFPNATPPAWVTLAKLLASYDVTELLETAHKDPAQASLASYFAFLTVQNSDAQSTILSLARLALEKSPECQQLMARINDDTGPSITVPAAQLFARTLGTIDRLPGMDAGIVKLLPKLRGPGGPPNGRLVMIDTLKKAGDIDTGEPSWHATARLIEDVTFVDLEAEAMHIAFKLGQPPTSFIDDIWPLVAKHRYADLMAGYRDIGTGGKEAVIAAMAKVRIDDPTLIAMGEVSQYWQNTVNPTTHAGIFDLLMGTDALASDEELKAQIFQFEPGGGAAMMNRGGPGFDISRLEQLAPGSPLLMAAKIKQNWDDAEPHLNEWLEKVGDHPSVTLAAAEGYLRARREPDAAKMFERYLAVSPDTKVFRTLAAMYQKQGDEGKWLSTLQRSLQAPAEGLQHAATNKMIAEYFVTQKRYKEALPFAEAAAGSYSAWGLDIAAFVNEQLGHWDRAEELTRDAGDNYNDATKWFEWCLRTGHGDLEAAKKYAAEKIAAKASNTDRESRTDRMGYALLIDDLASAESQAKEITQQTGDPWAGLQGVMMAAARHDDTARDQFLTWVIRPAREFRMPEGSQRPQLMATAKLIEQTIKKNSYKFDAARVDRIAGSLRATDAPNVYYFCGRYADIGGETDQARAFYEKCVACTEYKSNKTLAAVRLRELNEAATTQPK